MTKTENTNKEPAFITKMRENYMAKLAEHEKEIDKVRKAREARTN